jgi:hypothetical protein
LKFYVQCGVIVHGKTGCSRRSTQEYGPWLKAPSPTRRSDRNTGMLNSKRGFGRYGTGDVDGNSKRWEGGIQMAGGWSMLGFESKEEGCIVAEAKRGARNPNSQKGRFGERRKTRREL